jgi:trehalose 6-phosphate phosphatase
VLVGTLLERLAEEPAAAALLLDVDGTLAPIAPAPGLATVPAKTRVELARLVRQYALVACVSGRPSADAARVVGVEGIRYVGEHGLELDPSAAEWVERLRAFAATVRWPSEPGKRLSLAFHYRGVDNEEGALEVLRDVAERALVEGFRPRWGRKVLEIRPPLDTDKGSAVRLLLDGAGLERALYAGDDATDLDAFRALDGLEVAVRVAVVSEEGPSDLGRAADLIVGGPPELLELLRRL